MQRIYWEEMPKWRQNLIIHLEKFLFWLKGY